jgi:hypothetical protein
MLRELNRDGDPVPAQCPRCNGTEISPTQNGYWRCTRRFTTTAPGPGNFGFPGPPVIFGSGTCGFVFNDGSKPGSKICTVCNRLWNTLTCADCRVPLCTACARVDAGQVLCPAHLRGQQARMEDLRHDAALQKRRADYGSEESLLAQIRQLRQIPSTASHLSEKRTLWQKLIGAERNVASAKYMEAQSEIAALTSRLGCGYSGCKKCTLQITAWQLNMERTGQVGDLRSGHYRCLRCFNLQPYCTCPRTS